MHVVATAGHVDHGKSTLVRALTGMEPDRWAEERRRGLTVDLGYAWTSLEGAGADGGPADVAFVDVPGHRRFIGNMLAGLGPSPAVLLVVAADEGWREQTEEHLRAVEALRLGHGLVVVTRSDRADPGPALTTAQERVAQGSLGGGRAPAQIPAVAVSALTGEGLDGLRRALAELCTALPRPSTTGRVRLWVDRAFTVRGSGTVVTGTLEAGSLRPGEELTLAARASDGSGTREETVGVRSLQSLGSPVDLVEAPARVAVNLRGVPAEAVRRGDALLSPGSWPLAGEVDVRLDVDAADLPAHLTLHVGATHLPVRLRPLEGAAARLRLDRALPLQAGDRAILRVPGVAGSIVGLGVADVSPPPLTRSGSARRRGAQLVAEASGDDAGSSPGDRLAAEVARRGHLTVEAARLLGLDPTALAETERARHPQHRQRARHPQHRRRVMLLADHLVSAPVLAAWRKALLDAVDRHRAAEPLDPRLPLGAAVDRAGLPHTAVVEALAPWAGLEVTGGRIARPGTRPDLGAAQQGLDAVLARLVAEPFVAPGAEELAGLGLGRRELAAAASRGDLLRLADGVVLLPSSPARAMRVLAALPQPFTTSQARQALGTSRRVAIPLLEHLDARGWTRRVDAGHREVVR